MLIQVLCCIALTKRHCYKLSNKPFIHAKAVKPRLVRDYDIVLRFFDKVIAPDVTCHGINLSRCDLNGERIAAFAEAPPAFKVEP